MQGITAVRVAGVSGSILTPHTQKRWTELRSGKPLINLYGSTEMTLIACMRWENPVYDDMVSIATSIELKNTDWTTVLSWTGSSWHAGKDSGWGYST